MREKGLKRGIQAGIIFLMLLLAMSACGGGGGNNAPAAGQPAPLDLYGVFLDRNVRGLTYSTSPGGWVGTTGNSGGFLYTEGDTVLFSFGGFQLGGGLAQSHMTPVDIISGAGDENHDMVTNICRLLQTLDYDGVPDNGIELTAGMARAISNTCLDFSQLPEDFDLCLEEVVNRLNAEPGLYERVVERVTIGEAREHMRNTLWESMAGLYQGTFDGDFAGTWYANIGPDGNASGEVDMEDGDTHTVHGTVTSSGAFSFGYGAINGRLHPSSTGINGTWSIMGYAGAYKGTRQTRYGHGTTIDNHQSPEHAN